MDDLGIINLYNKTDEKHIKSFAKGLNSSLRVVSNYDKVDCNYEWLEIMEETVPYIDNILRNPNRFIINEEDVIKVELAKRVTVESIKHLSRNTNLIQEYDKKTGDVKPSKILNITKEESYDTYENRVVYTLIQNMRFFLDRKKRNLVYESSMKQDKKLEYNAETNVGREKVDVNMMLNTRFNSQKKEVDSQGMGIAERIEKLEMNIGSLTHSDVYRTIDKKHIALVTPPIKKTNVIMKNVNFQYAMKLWNFLQANVEDNVIRKKDKQDYMDDGELKDLVDETFLLNYLVADSINNEYDKGKSNAEIQDKLIANMVSKVVDLNEELTEEQLKNIVGKQFTVIKYKNVVSDKNIRKIFKDNIDKYLNGIAGLKI